MMGNILRFKTAVALVLLGLLTLLAGIGQKTFWAPAETVTATAPAGATAAPLTVFDEKLRTLHAGTVTINVKGEGSFILAAGRPDDVAAWVGKTAHNTVSGVSEDGKDLQLTHADGESTAPSPAGSDLWASTENASGELKYNWTPPADGDWSLLLAADGTKPAPGSITITFPNDTSTPWAVPFMVLGGLLILAGAALLALRPRTGGRTGSDGAGDSTGPRGAMAKAAARKANARKDAAESAGATGGVPVIGPSAGDPERTDPKGGAEQFTARLFPVAQRLRRSAAAVALLTATAVAGSGTAAQASQTPSPSPSTSAAGGQASGLPVLLDVQFRRILEQVSSAVDAGDAARDASQLAARVAGPELEVRTQNYKIRSQVGSYEARMPVRATKLLTTVVTEQRAWPRSVMAVTQGEGNVVPQLLTLTQASPRENYKLVLSTPLQPGTTFPGIARGGTETLAPTDKSGLLYSGEEALAGLGDRLNSADSSFKDKLTEGASSPYIADTLAYQGDVVNSGVNGTFAFTHKVVPESVVVFRTADGGALALGRLNFAFDGTPKAAGDKLTIGDDAAALAGGKETSTGMVLNFAESVAVFIPPAGSQDPMKLVAATRGLVGASFK
ncbi:hypothetical protein QK292_14055 [Arthrobacter sp. AL08]|uniref:hypothetical protein n=1 Tax=unclassified Arthrobacter TaxID=235627 RepID=UPI00249C8414|nr:MULTISPECIES: hypothetical protein [unclassified Arthrobacter]MDI3242581.1 hypothetical protein [Arthrobacter sp. AL05]MDI3278688.1 hypothetical protein [Arthrobacter sp. AL08]